MKITLLQFGGSKATFDSVDFIEIENKHKLEFCIKIDSKKLEISGPKRFKNVGVAPLYYYKYPEKYKEYFTQQKSSKLQISKILKINNGKITKIKHPLF